MKTSGLRDMKKGRSAPGLSLVPHSRKYGNDPDEIDPAHILPLPLSMSEKYSFFMVFNRQITIQVLIYKINVLCS